MQGIRLFTMEEIIWGDDKQYKWVKLGTLATRGSDTYKIPAFSDVALHMCITFLSDAPNCRAIYSLKGIGEPPLALAASVRFAHQQACMSCRQQQSFVENFIVHSSATIKHVRMACTDEFTERASFAQV
ncbi:unnamed protein product [Rotaria sp. Silwood1]|nr:unnamed protein product [Rotaria sp. Silwood1]